MAGPEGKKAQGGKPQQPQTPKQQQQKGDQTPKQQQPQTPKQQQQKGDQQKPQTPKQPQPQTPKQQQPQTPKQQQKGDQQKPQTPKPQTPKQKPEAAEPKQKKEQTPQQKKVTPTKDLVPVHNHDHDHDEESDDELALGGLPRSSFWAAEVEPRKAISKELYFPIKLKQVVLAPTAAANKVHTLYVVVEDKKWPLAVLGHNQNQVLLNVTFDAGLSITLLSESDATFYVYGNYFQDYDDGGFSDDEDDEDEIDFDSAEEDDDEDDEDDSEDSEIDQKVIASLNKRKAEANKPAPSAKAAAQPVKKQKNNEAEAVPKAQPAKQQPKAAPAEPQPSPVQTLSNGLKIQDLTVGKGPKPTKGKEVVVGYVGRLTNGRVFDRSANFKFRLGIGEVIKGWDLGVATMQVGGKRRLTVPGELAYGKRGAPPDIPPNATLIFDVDLKRA